MRWRLQGNTITPESFAIAGGRVTFDGSDWEAQYYITDHLGSTRAVTDTLGNVLATFDYTPYGELLAATDNTTAGTDYLFTGKENQAKQGAGELYDSQARFMDTEGRFLSIDPLAEKFYHLSPYTYCAGDPVNLVDPDGRMFGDFVDNKGHIIGNDGKKDGKVYAIKISKYKEFQNSQNGSEYNSKQLKDAKKFVEKNTGNKEAFLDNPEVYDCFIEIVGDEGMRQQMVDIVSKDDGKGGSLENNRREHGGYILNDGVYGVPSGDVDSYKINIRIKGEHVPFITNEERWLPTFHSHPSGKNSTGQNFIQHPYGNDFENAGSFTSYVFGRNNGNVYIYNNKGILSIIPQENFVNFK